MKSVWLVSVALLAFTTAWADVRVHGQNVREEKGIRAGSYIAPNEHFHYVYSQVVAPLNGALVSIGTFRSLDRGAVGGFSRVFMLDYDQQATDFNRLNLELLSNSSSREEYLNLLLNKRQTGRYTHDELQKILRQPLTPGNTKTILADLVEQSQRATSHKEATELTIFGSDAIFAKVKERAARGEYVPLNGSIVGEETLADLGKALRAAGEKVSAVDLSNALDHVFEYDWLKSLKPSARVIENLRALPLADNSVILLTAHTPIAGDEVNKYSGQVERWLFFAIPKDKFFNAAELGYFDTNEGYRTFLRLLIKNRQPQPWTHEGLIVPGESYKLTEPSPFLSNYCKSQMQKLLMKATFRAIKLF